MSNPAPQYAFVAGELSEQVLSRTDIERYTFGLKKARNFLIDYRGGAAYRPGTEFIGFCMNDTKLVKLFSFQYSSDDADSYILVFGDLYLRFIQSGGWVLETPVNITNITQASPAVVTATAHGFANGDWVWIDDVTGMTEVNQRVYEVANKTANTFELLDTPTLTNLDSTGYTAYSTGGTVSRLYTVTTPYVAADLAKLHIDQDKNEVTITRQGYDVRVLTRTDHTSWALVVEDFGTSVATPSQPTLTPSSAGTAGVVFGVTAVNIAGEESLLSPLAINELSVDYTATAGSMKVTWPTQSDVAYYKIYRSLVNPTGADTTFGEDMGYAGRAYGTVFNDPNILPDFTITPPQHYNPFADSQVVYINITAGGSSYAKADTVSVSGGGGSGFVGYPIVNDSGAITAVVIINPGSGYSSPVVTFGTSTGSGATATAVLSSATGNSPSTLTFFQQRRVYAGTENLPRTLFGSRPGLPSNMDVSLDINAGDSYSHELDSRQLSPIKHLIRTTRAMLAFTDAEVFEVAGFNNLGVTPLNINAEEQVFLGATDLRPLRIGNTVLYGTTQGYTVQGLKYNITLRSYQSEDFGVLSNHFFSQETELLSWVYIGDPARVVLGVRKDGRLLCFTYVDEENVKAWTLAQTKGLYESISAVKEGGQDIAYVVVKRYINGRWTRMIERFKFVDNIEHAEDGWFVDCGLERVLPTPNAGLTFSANMGSGVTVTADASVFSAGDVGKILRAGHGIAEVTAYSSGTSVTVTWRSEMHDTIPEDSSNTPLPVAAGEWTLASEITSISNLWHLEGETVSILVDGNVEAQKTVTNGGVDWTDSGSKVTIGIPYRGYIQTLPPSMDDTLIDHRVRKPTGVSVRLSRTRGLKYGADFDHLYNMKDRTDELWGETTRLRSDRVYKFFEGDMDEEGTMFFVQDDPLPANVTGLVMLLDLGNEAETGK